MGQTMQSGNTSVTGSVTTTVASLGLTTAGTGQTPIYKTVDISSDTTTTLHTATAGKTFYLTKIEASTVNGNYGATCTFKNDGTAFKKNWYLGTTAAHLNANCDFLTPIPIAATKVLAVTTAAGAYTTPLTINIMGFEQ